MTRPNEFPRWSPDEGDTSKFLEPPEALKDAGYAIAQSPPAQYFNWQFARQGDWIAHFDRARVAEVLAEMGATPWSYAAAGSLPALRTIGEALIPSVSSATITIGPGVALWASTSGNGISYVVPAAVALVGASNAGGGSARVDIVTIVVSAVETTTASTSGTIAIVQGTVGAGTPATPAGQVKIAEVTMQAGAAVYDAATLVDTRVQYDVLAANNRATALPVSLRLFSEVLPTATLVLNNTAINLATGAQAEIPAHVLADYVITRMSARFTSDGAASDLFVELFNGGTALGAVNVGGVATDEDSSTPINHTVLREGAYYIQLRQDGTTNTVARISRIVLELTEP